MKENKQTVKYLVGHYINFLPPREKEFHVDYIHDNLESAMKDWQYLCSELPKETNVEIRKQTTEFAVGRFYEQNNFDSTSEDVAKFTSVIDENVEKFASIIDQELTAIKESSVASEDVYPNTTKEEWLESTEQHKAYFQKEYEELKQDYENCSKADSTFVKAFGLPKSSFFPEPVLKEIFVDEEIISLVDGFMCGPAGLFNSKGVVSAEVQKYDNLHEMKIFLNVQAKTKNIIVYMTYKEGDKYCFRGAFVNK